MKERITYLLAEGQEGVNPANLRITEDSLRLPGIVAAKEWRVTLSADQLPEEIQDVLKDSHELHVRWASTIHYDHVTPLLSRLSPGLHAFYTPLKGKAVSSTICPAIKNIFGRELKCDQAANAFSKTQVLSERFASSAAYQYYQQVPHLRDLRTWLSDKICQNSDGGCAAEVKTLAAASLLDFDYDAISQAVVVSATWPAEYREDVVRQWSKDDRVEIGVLNKEASKEGEEISLGGFLTVLGDDDHPKPTLFSFPSRHHQIPASGPESVAFKASFRQPTGLHPTLQLTFDNSAFEPPSPSCSLHSYLTIPSTLFIDRYQFSDTLFLTSQNLVALRNLAGETDLEAPEWVTRRWGSSALFELLVPDDVPKAQRPKSPSDAWVVNIPMHLRYLPPRGQNDSSTFPPSLMSSDDIPGVNGTRYTSVPYPVVFWACPAESGLKMSVNPFDKVNLGYDGLFGPKTMFWHVPPNKPVEADSLSGTEEGLVAELEVPVLDLDKSQNVERVTGLVVLLGFAWICWRLYAGLSGQGEAPKKAKGGEGSVKKRE
ncbi:hypothetical protein CAC42_4313 [Sphaceloma murrayae]|uniref:Protein PBN1 n=1 Tax=Sphaceloma murrayae TaxID=2082308 RepID=A0A2K1QLL9_9PEZI|nr:hypothetical protein CAC42_4313 [Sphaceloma murrayae]